MTSDAFDDFYGWANLNHEEPEYVNTSEVTKNWVGKVVHMPSERDYFIIVEVYTSHVIATNTMNRNHQRSIFKRELLDSFHSNFQSYKKGIKYVEKFKSVQLYKL